MHKLLRYGIPAAICVFAACSRGASASGKGGGSTGGAGGSSSGQWIANGATACDKYLTPDVVGKFMANPDGKVGTRTPQGCVFEMADGGGNISITLDNGGPTSFTAMRPYWTNPVALAGVGDSAVQTLTGIAAVKGKDRGCSIDAGGAPGETK
ncbi:MAG: hypothetical protein ACREND_03920, partial [Gemmatimonadaceae bacterium]